MRRVWPRADGLLGEYTSHHEDPIRNQKGKGKGGKGKKGSSSLGEWPEGHDDQAPDEKTNAEVAGLFIGAVSQHARYNRRDWQVWAGIQKQAQRQWRAIGMEALSQMLSTLRWVRE